MDTVCLILSDGRGVGRFHPVGGRLPAGGRMPRGGEQVAAGRGADCLQQETGCREAVDGKPQGGGRGGAVV